MSRQLRENLNTIILYYITNYIIVLESLLVIKFSFSSDYSEAALSIEPLCIHFMICPLHSTYLSIKARIDRVKKRCACPEIWRSTFSSRCHILLFINFPLPTSKGEFIHSIILWIFLYEATHHLWLLCWDDLIDYHKSWPGFSRKYKKDLRPNQHNASVHFLWLILGGSATMYQMLIFSRVNSLYCGTYEMKLLK